MNNRLVDFLTSALNRATDTLFVLNPRGTSLGVFFGIALHGFLNLIHPALGSLRHWITAGRVTAVHFIAAGIVIFNLPHLFARRRLPDQIEDAFEMIRRIKREGASPAQVKLELLALCHSVVEKAKLDEIDPRSKSRRKRGIRKQV